MKGAKKAAVKEVRRFASERDKLFENVRTMAGTRIGAGWDVDALLRAPRQYLRLKFARVGVDVVRSFSDEARKVGKDHAEKLVATKDRRPDVQGR